MSGTSCPSLQEIDGIVYDSAMIILKDGVPTLSPGGTILGNPEGDQHQRCADARPLRPGGSGTYILSPDVLEGFCRATYEACPLLKKDAR